MIAALNNISIQLFLSPLACFILLLLQLDSNSPVSSECLTVGSRPVELVQIVRGQSLHHLKGPNSSLFKGKTVVIAPEWTQRELDLLECCDVIIHLASTSDLWPAGFLVQNMYFATTSSLFSLAFPSNLVRWISCRGGRHDSHPVIWSGALDHAV